MSGAAQGYGLRIDRLEIDDLRSIKHLRWPADEPGWGGRIPDVVVVGVGEGDETMPLEEIFCAAKNTVGMGIEAPHRLSALLMSINGTILSCHRNISYYETMDYLRSEIKSNIIHIKQNINTIQLWCSDLQTTEETSSALTIQHLEELRGEELERCSEELGRLTGGEERLALTDEGAAVVVGRDGARRGMEEGGRLVALRWALDLSRWWAPGSLVLLDELALGVEAGWQARLLRRIIDLRETRGGQVILATRSRDLYALAPQGSQYPLEGWF
jgi:hypothetical protein